MHNKEQRSQAEIHKELLHQKITPEYIYMTIPVKYVCVYHKLLAYMADFGKTVVDDCTATCKGQGKNILSCWAMFQSAIACHELHRDKEADLFINYIEQQLQLIYKGTGVKEYTGIHEVKLSPDGRLKAILTCGSEVDFHFDENNASLFAEMKKDDKYIINEKGELIMKTFEIKTEE